MIFSKAWLSMFQQEPHPGRDWKEAMDASLEKSSRILEACKEMELQELEKLVGNGLKSQN